MSITQEAQQAVAQQAEIEVIVNGGNRSTIFGYVTELKYDANIKELSFWLGHISMSKKKIGKPYTGYIEVFYHSYYAEQISQWIHDGMYIEVEGKLRLNCKDRYARATIAGAHVTPGKQVVAKIPVKPTEAING
jgi:primosomal replication protein N